MINFNYPPNSFYFDICGQANFLHKYLTKVGIFL